ncbi:MAG: competence/damage-inducible protein A [Betaproteobacteria bacterium]|nr:competence/damage-inducible protein A [Betaproteobacteria bacterium]
MNFGAIIIGDEIMSGRREDKHFARVIEALAARGLELAWSLHLGDDRQRLVESFRRSLAGGDVVFSFGGIGITPDDHTRQAVAAALGVELALHPDAQREIRARFGDQVTPLRLRLGEFPVGARIIPNPYNRIPGFSVGDHHFLPGFPVMAWPMMEWVLDTRYRHLHHCMQRSTASVVVWEQPESALLELMEALTRRYCQATVFSLPSFGGEGVRRHVELGVRGDPAQVAAAMEEIRAAIRGMGFEFDESPVAR